MTPAELQRLRALCERATPGPWFPRPKEVAIPIVPNDVAFIAAAREAVPQLLDEVEHLRAVAHVAAAAAEVHGYARAVADVVAWLRHEAESVGGSGTLCGRVLADEAGQIEQGAHRGAAVK